MEETIRKLQEFFADNSSGLQTMIGTLILLVCIDYITGVCVALREKKLSSKIGAEGLARKVMIFAMVGASAVIDSLLTGNNLALTHVTTLFYCVNELISIVENAGRIGLPLPQKLTDFLSQLQANRKDQKKLPDSDKEDAPLGINTPPSNEADSKSDPEVHS